jgi:hypothetical protein
MSTYIERLATELRNRFDDHDRVGFEAALARMVANLTYAGPVPLARQVFVANGKPVEGEHAIAEPTPVWPSDATRDHLREREWNNALDGCARKLGPCECRSPADQAVCMHRRPQL